jgi:hypothetical protein
MAAEPMCYTDGELEEPPLSPKPETEKKPAPAPEPPTDPAAILKDLENKSFEGTGDTDKEV